MQKILFILLLFSFTVLASCEQNVQDEQLPIEDAEIIIQEEISEEEARKQANQETVQNKIETIRKRLALKWLIIDGDGYYREWHIAQALVKYLEFYRKNPEDVLILEKIWDSYFSLNKYGSSLNYYLKIQEPSSKILDKIGLSLLYETDFNDVVSVKSTQKKLASIIPEWEILYYYTKSLDCTFDFHECKKDLWNYFWPESTTNEEVVHIEPTYEKLLSLKQAIENYRNFQVDEVYLKNAFIVASWYSNDLYSLSAHMWKNILWYKPGYKPILKIVAQSYFELWEFESAREMLAKYQDIDDEDPAVNYMLWIIHTQLRDYVLWNIHLSKAIKLWSLESLEIRRQLIHNFYSLENSNNLLSEFKSLIENEPDYTYNDLWLAIYHHILQWEYNTALKWAKLGKEKFTDNAGNFYAYEAWILREKWELELADSLLKLWIQKYPDNAFILINLWYTALELDNIWASVSYFKQVEKNHANTEFALSAQTELKTLSQK